MFATGISHNNILPAGSMTIMYLFRGRTLLLVDSSAVLDGRPAQGTESERCIKKLRDNLPNAPDPFIPWSRFRSHVKIRSGLDSLEWGQQGQLVKQRCGPTLNDLPLGVGFAAFDFLASRARVRHNFEPEFILAFPEAKHSVSMNRD